MYAQILEYGSNIIYDNWDSSRENVVSFIYIKVIKIIHV